MDYDWVVDQVVSEPFSTAEFTLPASEIVRMRVTSETCCRLRIGFLFPMPSAELKYK
jgi:hypothetical protein